MQYYVTASRRAPVRQITFDDFINGVNPNAFGLSRDTRDTVTRCVDEVSPTMIAKAKLREARSVLRAFVGKWKHLIDLDDKSSLYKKFPIPKRSGGVRWIQAPQPEIMRAQYELKDILEQQFFASYHTSAFAYIKNRCPVDATKRHQENGSKWFFKTDMKNFFPSTNPRFLMKMLSMIFPFCEFVKSPTDKEVLEKALSICFVNDELPQGTPISPMLTNLMMIPIDYQIAKMCREHTKRLCYTRYADDIHISSKYDFSFSELKEALKKILTSFEAPFYLHPDKTIYGSSTGRGTNYILGVVLNKDNEITIGHQKKRRFKATVYQFMDDFCKGKPWEVEETMHLQGVISYYRSVEKCNIDNILKSYSDQFGKNVEEAIKEILKQ